MCEERIINSGSLWSLEWEKEGIKGAGRLYQVFLTRLKNGSGLYNHKMGQVQLTPFFAPSYQNWKTDLQMFTNWNWTEALKIKPKTEFNQFNHSTPLPISILQKLWSPAYLFDLPIIWILVFVFNRRHLLLHQDTFEAPKLNYSIFFRSISTKVAISSTKRFHGSSEWWVSICAKVAISLTKRFHRSSRWWVYYFLPRWH